MRVVGCVPVPNAKPGSRRITSLACAGGSCQVGTIQNSEVISTGANCDWVKRTQSWSSSTSMTQDTGNPQRSLGRQQLGRFIRLGAIRKQGNHARTLPPVFGRRHSGLTEQRLLCIGLGISIFHTDTQRIQRVQRITQVFDPVLRDTSNAIQTCNSLIACAVPANAPGSGYWFHHP